MTHEPTAHTADQTPALRVQGVRKSFKDRKGGIVQAVRDVSLTLERGEVVALLGPNGAGKTTLLDMVLGLTTPDDGTVTVLGSSPIRAVAQGQISAMLQTGGLLWDLSVQEVIKVVASMYDHHLPVSEAMRRADLTRIAGRRISKCSGGEYQRIRFALAILPDPDLIILDEPTAGMDVSARKHFWETMQAEATAGRTVIFATHYLQEAETFADRIVLMQSGRIVADGPAEEISRSSGPRTLTFEVPSPARGHEVHHLINQLDHNAEIESAFDDTRFTVRTASSDELALGLLQAGATNLTITSPGLEAAFLSITSESESTAA